MSPRILVTGGTGGTGRHVIAALRAAIPGAHITAAARRAPGSLPEGATDFRELDLLSAGAGQAGALSGQDVAVLAHGPFGAFGDSAHRACLQAGVSCVDVNDCPETARRVLALEDDARSSGVRILTGMGLSPGLSSLLITHALERLGTSEADVAVRLFAGGDEPSGPAATRTMLELLEPQVNVLRDGQEQDTRADDRCARALHTFPTLAGPVPVFQCRSAEPPLLTGYPGLRADHRIHFQGMPRAIVDLIRAHPALRRGALARRLAALFNALHGKARKTSGNLARSILSVHATAGDREACCYATGATTFGMTAAFAAAATKGLVEGALQLEPGVHKAADRPFYDADLLSTLRAGGLILAHV